MNAPILTSPKRCAVYCRVSSDERLDQSFNSVDAQREAGHAFIKSQSHEGWISVADDYDDGGFSGGNMERPALKRLLADIEAGRIDIVVVYKIDRLTRSLTDFSRMIDVFERHGVSFVSVTQRLIRAHPCARPLRAASPSKSAILPICQHHHLDGAVDAQHPALLRPVRARGDGRAHPRQDRRQQAQGYVDGRRTAARLRRREPEVGAQRA